MAEGETATVSVLLSADPERSLSIPISTANLGGATNTDYTGVPSSLTFASGETTKTFTFAAADDTEDDDGEGVELGFEGLPAGVSPGDTPTATVSIADNDDPAVTVSFGLPDYTVAEGETATVSVSLSADPERSLSIPISAANLGGATNADYTGVPSSLTFANGETERTFTFTAADDSEDDDGEGVELGFEGLPAGVSPGDTPTATVSIADNDDPAVTVSFGLPDYTVAEGETATVSVSLSADPERSLSILISTTNLGGATSADYTGVPSSLTFANGETTKTFTFTAADDTEDDDGERVELGFAGLPAGVSPGDTPKATVSIADNDDPAVTVSFEAPGYTVAEGKTVSVSVLLSADPERSVSILISTANLGGATNADYTGVPSSLTFASGETRKTFTLTAADDTENDDGERVELGFEGLPTGVSPGDTPTATVSIADNDDPAVTVSFEAPGYTVAEGKTVSVSVLLSADPERSVSILISTANLGGATNADYTGVPSSLTFASGETRKTFTLTAADDTENDDGERVELGFEGLPTGVSPGDTPTATVSIADNDDPAVTVSFEARGYTVAEGRTVTVSVLLSADPERSLIDPDFNGQPGRSDQCRLHGGSLEPDIRQWRNKKDFYAHGCGRHGGR